MSELLDVKSTITQYRKWLRLGQLTVANYLGVTKSVMSAIESDPDRKIDIKDIIKLSNLFMCSTDELLGFKSFESKLPFAMNPRLTNIDKDIDKTDKAELNFFHHKLIALNTKKEYQEKNSFKVSEKTIPLAVEELLELIENDGAPVDVYSIASKLKIFVKFSVLNNLSGALIHSTKENGKIINWPGILLNSNQPENRIRFSLAHEIAHFYLGHYQQESVAVSELGRRFTQIEKDADKFASELLMPGKLIEEEFRKLKVNKLNEEHVCELSEKFIVSFQAMLIKLHDKGLITQSQKDSYGLMKVTDIKKRLKKNPKDDVPFDPSILNSLMKKNGFKFEDLNIDSIRLLQEMAYEYYQASVPFNKRATEVKTVYEDTVKWLSKEKIESLNQNVAQIAIPILEANDLEYVDKTPSKGCLWVYYSEHAIPVIEGLKRLKIHFNLAEGGGKATGHRKAWWLKVSEKENKDL